MVEPMTKSKKDQQVMDERIKAISDPIAEALNRNLETLTQAIKAASTSSTLVGLGLILTGLAAWCLFFLEIGKMCLGPNRPFETAIFAAVGGIIGVVILYAFKKRQGL